MIDNNCYIDIIVGTLVLDSVFDIQNQVRKVKFSLQYVL